MFSALTSNWFKLCILCCCLSSFWPRINSELLCVFICTWQLTLTLAVRGQRSTRKRACCSTGKTEENKLERETGLLLRDFVFALDCEAFQRAAVVQARLRGVILLVKVRLSQQSRRQAELTHEQTLLTKNKSGECRLKWRGAQTTGRSGRVRSLSNQLQKSSSSGRKRVVHPNLNDLSVSLKGLILYETGDDFGLDLSGRASSSLLLDLSALSKLNFSLALCLKVINHKFTPEQLRLFRSICI